MIVLDASAAVEMVLRSPAGGAVLSLVEDSSAVHYPELMPVEVMAVLRRLVAHGLVSHDRAADALTDLLDLRGDAHRHGALLAGAFPLTARFTAYDAVYLTLAMGLDAPLVTLDRRLARQAEALVGVVVPG